MSKRPPRPAHGLSRFFAFVLTLALLAGPGCSNKKVAEASRQKALELIGQGDASAPALDASPAESASPAPSPTGEDAQASGGNIEAGAPPEFIEKRLYIDGSKSMMGFAGHGGDFDRFFSEIGYILGDPVVYKFGSPSKTPGPKYDELIRPTTLGREQRSPGFYNLHNNPDDVLFDELNRSGRKSLSVYVSDGVYSASDARAGSKVITPLAEWLAGGRVLGIFVLKSRYKGSFYSEKACSESGQRRCWLPDVDTLRRPFYAFVFSPDEDSFRRLQREMEVKFKEMKTLVFSDRAISSEGLNLPEEKEGIYDSGRQSEGYYWQMFTPHLFSEQSPALLSFSLSYVVDKEYPLGKIDLRVSAKYYLWDAARSAFVDGDPPPLFRNTLDGAEAGEPAPRDAESRPDASPEVAGASGVKTQTTLKASAQKGSGRDGMMQRPEPTVPAGDRHPALKTQASPQADGAAQAVAPSGLDGTQSAGFVLRIPRDTRSLYGLYHVRLQVEVGEVSPFVEGLSTDDDSDPAHADRTYRFSGVMKALLASHLRGRLSPQIAPPLFLTISD